MKIADTHIAGLGSLGYTAVEARFLYIVASFSGYFVPRQFITFTGAKPGRSGHFTGKLESRGHATWREYPHLGGVYHLVSRTLFRQVDKESLRNYRRHSTPFIRTRLLLLDFVLANPDCAYLETEDEKVGYFHGQLGIPKELLPAKAYTVSPQCPPVVRYFPDNFPLFLRRQEERSASGVTFCFVASGDTGISGFSCHLNNYKRLFSRLGEVRFLYISNSVAHFASAEKRFRSFVERSLCSDLSAELRRYFRLRLAWDEKRYGSLSHEDIEWLEQASGRFRGHDAERLYEAWRSGDLPDEGFQRYAAGSGPLRIAFECSVVGPDQATPAEQPEASTAFSSGLDAKEEHHGPC